ncbi:MAG: hypothetical protein IV103_13665 [Zoogloea sp.]|nr:hypothetical protein [Zoogloea sp.]
MSSQGYAMYNASNNTLEVIRPGECCTRIIRCTNLHPASDKVHGVAISGDEILVYVSAHSNSRPGHVLIYSFRSLSGGGRRGL